MNFKETAKFDISIIGESSNEKWVGQFECLKRLSHRLELQKDSLYRGFLGPNPDQASQINKDRSEVLAECAVSLVSSPKWWQEMRGGLDLIDNNVLTEVWGNIIKIRAEAIKQVQDQAKKSEEVLKKEALAQSGKE